MKMGRAKGRIYKKHKKHLSLKPWADVPAPPISRGLIPAVFSLFAWLIMMVVKVVLMIMVIKLMLMMMMLMIMIMVAATTFVWSRLPSAFVGFCPGSPASSPTPGKYGHDKDDHVKDDHGKDEDDQPWSLHHGRQEDLEVPQLLLSAASCPGGSAPDSPKFTLYIYLENCILAFEYILSSTLHCSLL